VTLCVAAWGFDF
jgi:hypothetical protein